MTTIMPAVPSATTGAPLLRATGIQAAYHTPDGRRLVAVEEAAVTLRPGEVLGVAGESGCGKSTLGAVLSLTFRPPLHVLGGELAIDDQTLDLTTPPPRWWRGEVVSLLPQGAMSSLSPTVRIRDFAYHVIKAHQPRVRYAEAVERTAERLATLDLPRRVLDNYPHQLSGGMKQRVVAVISTLLNPRLLVADEPTSALDVSSQRVLVEMLREMLSRQIIGGIVFITHDLPVLSTIASRVAIMYAGRIIEVGTPDAIVDRPRHPYTAALISSVLVPEPELLGRRVRGIPGAPPSLLDPPAGCRFHPRCPLAMELCRESAPLVAGDVWRSHACWWADQHPGQSPPLAAAEAAAPAAAQAAAPAAAESEPGTGEKAGRS